MTELSEFDQRLKEIDELDRFKVSENYETVECPYCEEEHLGELFESPPDGFYIRYWCSETEQRGRTSFA